MSQHKTSLTKQEKQWISEQRVTRLSDNQEVLIYPMGAERYLYSLLFGNKKSRYNIRSDIKGKDILIIPGYGNSGFLFVLAGAKSVTVYDKDPVTIAWVKAFKKYYNYREFNAQGKPYPSIGELLTALTCWYPPLLSLPSDQYKNRLCWVVNPNSLRRTYIFYMLTLVRQAIESKVEADFELDKKIQFHVGELNQLIMNKKPQVFDTAYVPYLLGVRNGIENEEDIVQFIEHLTLVVPKGSILVSPSRSTREFYITGQRYFITTGYSNIENIPKLNVYLSGKDKHWFKTQGLAVFSSHKQ